MTLKLINSTLTDGYGVASGRGKTPYPRGTIEMQTPHFRERGLNLESYFQGTLNLSIEPLTWHPKVPLHHFENVRWYEQHAPEDFSFFRCIININASPVTGLIYYPSPKTKVVHFHSPTILEVLAPWIDGLAVGGRLSVGIDPNEIEIQQPL